MADVQVEDPPDAVIAVLRRNESLVQDIAAGAGSVPLATLAKAIVHWNSVMSKVSVHRIPEETPEIESIGAFARTILAEIEKIETKKLKPVVICLDTILTITGNIPKLSSAAKAFIKLFSFYKEVSSGRAVTKRVIHSLLAIKSLQANLICATSATFLMTQFTSHAALAECAAWFSECFIAEVTDVDVEIEIAPIPDLFLKVMNDKNIPKEHAGIVVKYFCHMLSLLKKGDFAPFQYFVRHNGLAACWAFLAEEAPECVEECFVRLCEMRPNEARLDVIVFCQSQIVNPMCERGHEMALGVFVGLLSNENLPMSELEKAMPIDEILNLVKVEDEAMKAGVRILTCLFDRRYKRIVECVLPIFKKISQGQTLTCETLEFFFAHIQNAFADGTLDMDMLLKDAKPIVLWMLFSDRLEDIVKNCPSYVQILVDVYVSAENNTERVGYVLDFLSKAVDDTSCSAFLPACAQLMASHPKITTMKLIMQSIDDSTIGRFVSVFRVMTSKMIDIVKVFLECKGLEWVDAFVTKEILSVDDLSDLVTNLLKMDPIEPVSIWMSKLDVSHPLFAMPLEVLWRMAFGSTSLVPMLLKAPALLPTLTSVRACLSPINAYLGAKYGLGEFLRRGISVMDVDYLKLFANQYLRPEHYRLLESEGSGFVNFVDPKYNHFPLWEMAPNSRESTFSIDYPKYKRVCFWTKTDESPGDFHNFLVSSPEFSLEVEKDLYTIRSGCNTYSIMAKTDEWTFVSLEVSPDSEANSMTLWINKSKQSLPFKKAALGGFRFGSSDNVCQKRWFIGPFTRLHENMQVPTEKIFSLGPNNSQAIEKEERVLSPFSKLKTKGSTVFSVPYAGFSHYVAKRATLARWFLRLAECSVQEQFSDIFSMLLNCYLVVNGKLPTFLIQMCHVLKLKREFVDDTLVKRIFFVLQKVPTNAHKFFNDLDLWELYGHSFGRNLMEYRMSLPGVTCVYELLTHPSLRDMFLTLLIHYCQPADTYLHIVLLLFTSHEEIKSAIVADLFRKFEPTDVELRRALTMATFVNVLRCQPVSQLPRCLDLLVLLSASEQSYASGSIQLVPVFAKVVNTRRVWFQALSLLTGVAIFDGLSLITVFDSQEMSRPSFLPVAVGLGIFGLIYMALTHDESFSPVLFEFLSVLNTFFRRFNGETDLYTVSVSYWPLISHANLLKDVKTSREKADDSLLTLVATRLQEVWQLHVDVAVNENECEGKAENLFMFLLEEIFPGACPTSSMSNGYPITSFRDEQRNILEVFVSNLILSQIGDLAKFRRMLHVVGLQTVPQFIRDLCPFAMRVLVLVMKSEKFLTASSEINLAFFASVGEALSTQSFSGVLEFYQELLPCVKELWIGQHAVPALVVPLQSLLLTMFDYLEWKLVDPIVTDLMTNYADIYEPIRLFSPTFCSQFRKRVSRMQAEHLEHLQLEEDPETIEYSPEPDNWDASEWTGALTQYIERDVIAAHLCTRGISACFENLLTLQLDLFLRGIERDTAKLLTLYWTCHMQRNEGQSMILQQLSMPFYPNRVMTQSPFPVSLEKPKRTDQVAQPASAGGRDVDYVRMYDVDCTDLSMGTLDVTKYSLTVPMDNKLRLKEFLLLQHRLGEVEAKENALFRRNGYEMTCVLFTMPKAIVILFNASLSDDGLEFEDRIMSWRLYDVFLQTLKLGFYGSFSAFCGHIFMTIPTSSVCHARKHALPKQRTGVTIYTTFTPEFVLIPTGEQFSSQFQNAIFRTISVSMVPQLHTLGAAEAVKMWSDGSLSTWELLLTLNGLGGRSFADVSQYPVFPWLYGYDESGQTVKRDLAKPMGQQSAKRAEEYQSLYSTNKSYYYPTHYSTAHYVRSFLVRVPPFMQVELNASGTFCDESKLFTSVSKSWLSASQQDMNDVRELVPEMFCLPEMFLNVTNATVSKSKFLQFPASINGDIHPQVFALRMLGDLEAEPSISQWIDLIFGWKQRGNGALGAKNLFPPASYDILGSDQDERVGYCPLQLFTKPIQAREQVKSVCFSNLSATRTSMTLTPLMALIPSSGAVFRVIPGTTTVSVKGGKATLNWRDAGLYFAKSVSKSALGEFIAIDLETDGTMVVQLKFANGNAREVTCLAQFPHDFMPNTRINGTDLICATYHKDSVVLWDIRRSVIVRRMKTPGRVIDMGFDEYLGLIVILCGSRILIQTINDLTVTSVGLKQKPTCLCIPYVPSNEIVRPIFVGFVDGSVYMLGFDYRACELRSLWSRKLANDAIVRIESKTMDSVLCKDSCGKTFLISSATE